MDDKNIPPVWACSQYGQSGHDWIDCPECNEMYEAWLDSHEEAYQDYLRDSEKPFTMEPEDG